MIKKVLFAGLFAFLVIPVGQVSASSLFEDYSLADGIITDKKPWSSMSDIKQNCRISYDVTIDGHDYSEQDAVNHEFCYLEVADTIKIKYLTSDSREHAIASKFEISDIQKQEQENQFQFMQILPFVFPLFFIVIVFIIIIAAIRQRKNADFDGDGLANDNKPATAEQKKLIQEGFRQLGIHHEAKRGLTQAQARETLREIDRKLKRK